ncbi:MAG: dihydrolipoyl dehydrogenase [Desulfobulbus sp.]|uniref:dihydrolipoyl dehydrogenase n=1 Tax=Desulfobulbus sp. TaxID=895 RepID=UPI002846E143|nr:dihydrolipoyl dehydrogenase [Desulfobulbus sp.]MDR2549617.1 dihydrolipoyl dehydrogenase [Desulfobulbus sp.]
MEHAIETDLAVLGGGPGGYTAAFRAADLGLAVCLIEQGPRLGGVCLHAGCMPSKTLLHAAAAFEEARAGEVYGLRFDGLRLDIAALRSHKIKIVEQLAGGLDSLVKARKITRITGRGRFVDDQTLVVDDPEGSTGVRFGQAIIATGSRPAPLACAPRDPRIWDSTDALALPAVPPRLLIVGGGIVGLEMAQVYHALGAGITMIEAEPQIIPAADRDVVQPLFLQVKNKYRIWTGTKVAAMTARAEGIEVALSGGTETTELFDAVLVAVGRRPNLEDIGLETLGLAPDRQGRLAVDARLQTAMPRIFAIGDVTDGPMLAHKAIHQGKVAAEAIAGQPATFAPAAIPAVAYTHPEVAWVGLTEREAARQGIVCAKGKFPWGASGRALSAGAGNGVSKALFDAADGRLLGAGICGLNAGELIHEAALALETGATAETIARTVHAHPTLAETFAGAAGAVCGSVTDLLPARPRKRTQ